jgi:hypothetical protein
MMRGGDDRDSPIYLQQQGSFAQVAEGSFDLSTACPAGYVPFLSREPSVFSLAEGILPRLGDSREAESRQLPHQLPLFILLPSERLKELISDISWRKGFTHAASRERDGSEGGRGKTLERRESERERRQGRGRGSAVAPKLPHVSPYG